ncbi:MAG: nickel-binding protein [Promethearchaeota archaeon]
MPKFIVVHSVPRNFLEQMAEVPPEENKMIIKLRKACNYDAYWIRTWAVLDHEKLYCEWNAKDAESIRKIWDENIKGIGIDSIAEMQIVDGEDYREK